MRVLLPLSVSLLTVLALPAAAAEPLTDMMFTAHDLDAASTVVNGTVSFAMKGVAVFASDAATDEISIKKGRLSLKQREGHPVQSHHKSAESISLGEGGALALLTDDRRRLQIARYTAAGKWVAVERPIGFVPRGAAVVSNLVVFPQAVRSPAWFVFDATTNAFSRIARPSAVPSCAGVTFARGPEVVVVGADGDGKSCSVALDPATARWKALPAPKAVVPSGGLAVTDGPRTYIVGSKTPSVVVEEGKWANLPSFPSVGARTALIASNGAVIAWSIQAGKLTQWALAAGSKTVVSKSEAIDVVPVSVVQIAPTSWLVAGRRDGRPVVVEVEYSPSETPEARAANRASFSPQPAADVDWKTATEAQRQAALQAGLGAVERYVPPELGPTGKVVTKGAWVFALGEELVVWPVTPKACQRFIDKMVAKWPTSVVGTTWKTERGAGFARAGKKILYSPRGQCRDVQKCATDYFSQRAIPLSQVGPIFSYTEHISAARDCGDPVNTERWHTIDLRTGKAASMTAVIKPESILAALRKHKAAAAWVGDATTLDDAIARLRKQDPLGFERYAFGGWRSATRQVELRLEYHPGSADIVEPLKLWVDPADDFLDEFEDAARTKGLYMGSSQ